MVRAHMVVLGHLIAATKTDLKADRVVDGHGNRLAQAFVGLKCGGVDFRLLVGADDDHAHGHNFGAHIAETIHHIAQFANGFVQHVNFV